jgi:hypothetical protein
MMVNSRLTTIPVELSDNGANRNYRWSLFYSLQHGEKRNGVSWTILTRGLSPAKWAWGLSSKFYQTQRHYVDS